MPPPLPPESCGAPEPPQAPVIETIIETIEDFPLPPLVSLTTTKEASELLRAIEQVAAVKPALIYVSFSPPGFTFEEDFSRREAALTEEYGRFKEKGNSTPSVSPADSYVMDLLLVTEGGESIRVSVPGATRKRVLQVAEQLYKEVSNLGSDYLAPAQQMYQWLIAPIETELQAQKIDSLLFIMPVGLRLVPIAALHDRETNQYVAQKYNTGFAPSLSLTATSYRSIKDSPVLALGASVFSPDQNQPELPAVKIEVPLIASEIRDGKFFLDEEFIWSNLQGSRQANPYPIIHLATHADFEAGDLSQSYIQLYDEKLKLNRLRELNLNDPTVELLVISACRSAYGDEEAELGFGGLAVQTGVKTVLASLWYVGDAGTLALMAEFYHQLGTAPIKASALRLAQVAMIEGRVQKEEGELVSFRGSLPLPEESVLGEEDLSHPFYWAAFTMLGSPW